MEKGRRGEAGYQDNCPHKEERYVMYWVFPVLLPQSIPRGSSIAILRLIHTNLTSYSLSCGVSSADFQHASALDDSSWGMGALILFCC